MMLALLMPSAIALWEVPCVDPTARVCPYLDGASGYSQSGEDMHIRNNYYCDVCSMPVARKGKKLPVDAVEPGQRTYVEIGALDGRLYSNTLMLERNLEFGGVLIEGHPENAAKLRNLRGYGGAFNTGKRTRNHIVGEAVCAGSGFVTYVGGAGGGTAGAMEHMSNNYLNTWSYRFKQAKNYTVPCRPIGEMIRGAGISHVDLFSLDVEGAELTVLKTFDFRISVGVWLIEADGHDKAKDKAVTRLLEEHGYKRHGRIGANYIYLPTDGVGLAAQRKAYCTKCILEGKRAQVDILRAEAAALQADIESASSPPSNFKKPHPHKGGGGSATHGHAHGIRSLFGR